MSRAAAVAQLRGLADRLERLALSEVAEILILLEPVLANHCISPVVVELLADCPLIFPLVASPQRHRRWPNAGAAQCRPFLFHSPDFRLARWRMNRRTSFMA
jgi:hypothetical protein